MDGSGVIPLCGLAHRCSGVGLELTIEGDVRSCGDGLIYPDPLPKSTPAYEFIRPT